MQAGIAAFRRQNGEHARFDDLLLRPRVEARLRVKRAIDAIKEKAREPSLRAAKKMYEANRDSFQAAPCIRASQIVKHVNETATEEEARQAMERALAELEAGASFKKTVAKYSDCPERPATWAFFPLGHMVEEFDEAVFPLAVGERTGIFQTFRGFHIVEVTGKRPMGPRPFAEVREQIEKTLRAAAEYEALRAATEQFRKKAEVRRVTEEEFTQFTFAAAGGAARAS